MSSSTVDSSSGTTPSISVALRGSIGYVAPEYGMGDEISAKGDVYSFGILLLEMFTGKRPTDEMFKEGESLHKFAKLALSGKCHVGDVADAHMDVAENSISIRNGPSSSSSGPRSRLEKHLASVIEVGVLCSAESARERPDMQEVTVALCRVRNHLIASGPYVPLPTKQ